MKFGKVSFLSRVTATLFIVDWRYATVDPGYTGDTALNKKKDIKNAVYLKVKSVVVYSNSRFSCNTILIIVFARNYL
jgi:hypothetical protein